MTGLVLLLAVGAVYRLTLLVVADTLAEGPRDRLVARWTTIRHRRTATTVAPTGEWTEWACTCGETWEATATDTAGGRYSWQRHVEGAPKHRDSKPATLITCAWCASMWVAAPVLASAATWGGETWWQVAAGTLTASAATGALATVAAPD